MTTPFAVRRPLPGVVQISRAADEAFRKALMMGVPPSVRPKMKEALAALPPANAREHSQRYFGKEADQVFKQSAELAAVLHQFLADQFGLTGFLDWLNVTNYGNDYRMIKAFKAWAEVPKTLEPSPKLDA